MHFADAGHSDELSEPDIKFDREGNAMALWEDGLGQIMAGRYSDRSLWLEAERIADLDTGGQGAVLAPLFEDGRMLALWYHFDDVAFRPASALFSD